MEAQQISFPVRVRVCPVLMPFRQWDYFGFEAALYQTPHSGKRMCSSGLNWQWSC